MNASLLPRIPAEPITSNEHDPTTASWLLACRKLDPCDDETFSFRVPFLIRLGLRIEAGRVHLGAKQ